MKYLREETVVSKKDKEIIVENYDSREENISEKSNSVIIEPAPFFSNLNLREIWGYRELLYFLALRDIKIRYKQTLLGIAWVLIQPIVTTLIFTIVFRGMGVNQNLAVPYPLFAFSGFVLWTFINSAILNCSGSLVNHSNLITKVYFPRLIVPISAIGATLLDLIIGLAGLLVVMLVYGIVPTSRMLLVAAVIIPTLLLTLGIGIFTAALNVKYRDVKYILPLVIQTLFFISPVFYSISMIPADAVWLWELNPVAGILENFRALAFGLEFNWQNFGLSFVISVIIFILAVFVFHRMEDDFADVI